MDQFRDDKRCVEDLMAEAKFVVTPESKQLEFEAALLAHEDEICAEYDKKQEEAAEAAANGGDEKASKTSKSASNGKNKDDLDDSDDDARSRNGDRRGRSRSKDRDRGRRSRSRSRGDRSRSGSRSRGRGGKDKEKKGGKGGGDSPVKEEPPKRGFQEILDKRAVNLGIIFDALVEKAVVKRKEEVGILCRCRQCLFACLMSVYLC